MSAVGTPVRSSNPHNKSTPSSVSRHSRTSPRTPIVDEFVADAHTSNDAFSLQMRKFGIELGSLRSNANVQCFRAIDSLAAVRRLISTHLSAPASASDAAASAVASFASYINRDDASLRRVLRPLLAPSYTGGGSQNPSLVRLLLGHSQLQTALAIILLEKFCVSIEDEDQFVRADLHDNIPKLILRQVRFLECVYDGMSLANKLVEIITTVPMFAKRELLACLPEIIDDSCHASVIPALHVELEQSPELAVPILDAIAQLNVDPHHLANTRRAAVAMLGATRLTDTPLVVRFLVLSAPVDSFSATVDTLREQLAALLGDGSFAAHDAIDCEHEAEDDEYNAGYGKQKMPVKLVESKVDAVTLLVDSLRVAMASRRGVAKCWMQYLETAAKRAANDGGGVGGAVAVAPILGVADVWLLLCQHASGADGARDTDVLIRRLVACELLESNLLCSAVRGEFASCVELLGTSALALAGSLVRGSLQAQRDAGCSLYLTLFEAMKSGASRTSVIGALVTHVGSASPLEMEAALQTLVQMAESRQNAPALLQLAPFINGLLDFLEGLNDAQVRLVFRVFTAIASADEESNTAAEGVRNELRILMHKQLSHTDISYKRIGVIGAVTHLARVASAANAELGDDAMDESASLVRSLFDRASTPPTCMALLFDELASAVTRLHPQLVSHVLASLLHALPPLQPRENCNVRDDRAFWYCHTAAEESELCCDVIGTARLQEQQMLRPQSHLTRNAVADSAAALAASLRLAQAASRVLRASGVGNALQCALLMFPWHAAPATLALVERMTEARAVFYAHDWLRQTASGAALDVLADQNWSGADERLAMVRTRIGDVLENERRLELYLRVLPEFSLPTVNGGAALLRKIGGTASKRGSRGKATPKAKKTKSATNAADADDEGDDAADNDGDDDDPPADDDEIEKPAAPVSAGIVDVGDSLPLVDQLRPTMRELDVAVFAALACREHVEPLCIEALANDLSTKLAAHAALEKPLTARRVQSSGTAAFLAAHSPLSALMLVAPAVGALAMHATRLHLQLVKLSRTVARDTENNNDDADADIENGATLPDGAPELMLDSEVAHAERALAAIFHVLSAVFRCSAVKRHASFLVAMLTQLARCIAADTDVDVPRAPPALFKFVFDHVLALGQELPSVALLETAASLLDALSAMIEVQPASDASAQNAAQLSTLAEQWLRASWARHRDGKFHAEPLRRVVHACVRHAVDQHAVLRVLSHASARFALTVRATSDTLSPMPADAVLEDLLPPTHELIQRGDDDHDDNDDNENEDDGSDVPLSRRVREVHVKYATLTSTTWPFWVAAINIELVSTFRRINTDPSPRYVENVEYICDLVRVWRIVLETCNLGATLHVMRSLLRDGTTLVSLITDLTKTYLQQHIIECIEPLSVLFEDVSRCSHVLHAVCETTKDKKDAMLAPLVPRAKRVLESLSLNLRAVLIAHKLSDSFSVLVQRDLRSPANGDKKKKSSKRKSATAPNKLMKKSPPASGSSRN